MHFVFSTLATCVQKYPYKDKQYKIYPFGQMIHIRTDDTLLLKNIDVSAAETMIGADQQTFPGYTHIVALYIFIIYT